jgi:D-tyrosyl-tRNA(Tyr) deacylase
MRALIQRTSGAKVTEGNEVAGEIGPGLVVFVCAMRGDTEAESAWLARKTAALRIFRDGEGRMNRSVVEVGGAALVVSQFTLAAETRGNRPGFSTAAAPEAASRRGKATGSVPRAARGMRTVRFRVPGRNALGNRKVFVQRNSCAPTSCFARADIPQASSMVTNSRGSYRGLVRRCLYMQMMAWRAQPMVCTRCRNSC